MELMTIVMFMRIGSYNEEPSTPLTLFSSLSER